MGVANDWDDRQWQRDGVLVLRKFFSGERIHELNKLLERLWKDRAQIRKVTIDAWLESPQRRRLLFRRAASEVRSQPYKLNDLYLISPLIREAILDPRLCNTLNKVLEGEPLVCNSLNFEFGSRQTQHIDSLFMTPRHPNRLAVSWIALDDVDNDNGPVSYYPGSHLIEPYRFSDGGISARPGEMKDFHRYIAAEIEQRNIQPVTFRASPGDVLIWHAQLLHGGSPIHDMQRRRRSLVTHYFRRRDYRHHFWRIRRQHANGYYLKRRHPKPD